MKLILNSAAWAGQPVTITGLPGSTLAGKSRTIQTWGTVPQVEGGLVVNDNATISLIMDESEPARPILINGESVTVDPALLANGPICLKAPVAARYSYGGNFFARLVSPGIWAYDPALGPIHKWETAWYKNAEIHYRPTDDYAFDKDKDKATDVFTYREVRTQGDKVRFADSNPILFA